jgi:cytochrome P450
MNPAAPALADDPVSGLDPADPYPIYAELRSRAPAHWSRRLNSWVLTRYDDVRSLLDHPDFRIVDPASRLARVASRGGPSLANLTSIYSCISSLTDPSRSPAVKRVFFELLAGWRRLGARELLAARATALLDGGATSGCIDLAAGYARRLAVFAFGTLFGIPEAEHEALAGSTGLLSCVGRVVHPLRELARMEADAAKLVDHFRILIAERRGAAADDGLARLVRAADSELGWGDDELAGFCAFLLIAARESTSTAIGGCAARLLDEPRLREHLRENPASRPAAIRELLRLVSPFQYVSRTAVRDTVIADQPIRASHAVCAMLGAANRDPLAFPDPDSVDLARRGPEPLTFSSGAFRCLGDQLAQSELRVAIDGLLDHPHLRLADEPAVWGPSMHVLELRHLPAEFARG